MHQSVTKQILEDNVVNTLLMKNKSQPRNFNLGSIKKKTNLHIQHLKNLPLRDHSLKEPKDLIQLDKKQNQRKETMMST